MNKQILQVKQKYEKNVYKSRTYNIPFENILFYEEQTTDDDIEYVVIIKEYGAIDVSKEEYDEVVKYFNSQEKESESSIESTAFEIIKKKKVDVGLFMRLYIDNADVNKGGWDSYIEAYKHMDNNAYCVTEESRTPLTKDEFDTLLYALKK